MRTAAGIPSNSKRSLFQMNQKNLNEAQMRSPRTATAGLRPCASRPRKARSIYYPELPVRRRANLLAGSVTY